MSGVLQAALENSRLLRPLVILSRLEARSIGLFWRASWLGQGCTPILSRIFPNEPPPLRGGVLQMVFHPILLLLGVLSLFGLSVFLETSAIGLATWALLGYGLLGSILTRRLWLPRLTAPDGIILLFFLSAVLSAAASSFLTPSLMGLAKMMTFLAGYLVFRAVCERCPGFLLPVLGFLVVLGLLESLVGFYQYSQHLEPLATWQDPELNPELEMTRVFGTIQPNNPNLLAGFLVPCFAAATGLGFYALSKVRTTGFPAILSTVRSWGAAGVILAALVMTGSRGGYLAIAVMFLVMFFYAGHLIFHEAVLKRQQFLKVFWALVLLGSLVGVGGILATSEKLQHRVASIFAMREDSSISYRLNVYQSAWEMFQDNWLVGIGPGNDTFKQVYGLYMVPGFNALGAYSVPLEIAVEQGIIGLFLFLLMLAVLKMRTAFFVDSDRPLTEKILVGTLFTGITGSVVYGFFDTIWYRPAVNLLFWFFVAALAWLTEKPADSSSTRASTCGGG